MAITPPADKEKAEKVREVVRQHLLELLASDAEVREAVGHCLAVEPLAPAQIGRPQESEAALSERMLDVLEVGVRRLVRPEALRRP